MSEPGIGTPPPGMVLVTVLVPPGVGPGGQLQLESPYGGRFAVNVPEGVSPGQMMHVHVPGPTGGAVQMPPSQLSAPVEASEEDVAQLAAIFPDIDNEVLVLILETCGGASAEARLEEAISQLLDMSGDVNGDMGSSPPQTPPHMPSSPPAHAEEGLSQMEADERMARELAAEMGQHNIDADEVSLTAQTPSLALPRPRPAVRLPPQRRHRSLRARVCAHRSWLGSSRASWRGRMELKLTAAASRPRYRCLQRCRTLTPAAGSPPPPSRLPSTRLCPPVASSATPSPRRRRPPGVGQRRRGCGSSRPRSLPRSARPTPRWMRCARAASHAA